MNLMLPFAQQVPKYNWFELPAYSQSLILNIVIATALGFGMMYAFTVLPQQARKYVVGTFTFLSGLFYILLWLWPKNINYQAGQIARSPVEQFAIGLQETVPRVSDIAQILTGFLLLLGIMSLLRIHITRATRTNQDAVYSRILLVSMGLMVVIGYTNWYQVKFADTTGKLNETANWGLFQYANDLLFDGVYQQMEAAMFSIIAFYILSAAYRAFRIKSIESSVLMGSALILMLSLMGALVTPWGSFIDFIVNATHNGFFNNFKIEVIAGWVKDTLQTPSIRAIEFGIGLGALAMGLRIWLGLEKGGGGA